MPWDNDVLTSLVDRLAEYPDGDDPLFKVFRLDDTAACARAGSRFSVNRRPDLCAEARIWLEDRTCRAALGLQVGQLLRTGMWSASPPVRPRPGVYRGR